MRTHYKIPAVGKWKIFKFLMVLLTLPVAVHGQDIDFNNCPNPEFPLPAVTAGVLMAPVTIGTVDAPGAATMVIISVDFPLLLCSPCASPQVFDGLTLEINGDEVELSGTPDISLAGSEIIFTIQAQSTSNCQRTYTMEVQSPPMDLVLVLDRSGSMNTNTSAGVSRWNALSDAVVDFANIYQALDRDDDQLSITYFETDLNPASVCCSGFVPFSGTIATSIDGDLGANAPGGSTAMGLGLKNGESKLSDNSRARSILLFTDGRQNKNPLVDMNGQGYSDGTNIDGGSNPGGIKIATIGIDNPNGDYQTTLQNLALNNRGAYYTTSDGTSFDFEGGENAGDMSSGFIDQFVDLLTAFSPQLVARASVNVSQGPAPHEILNFTLNRRVNQLLLHVAFDQKLETPQLVQLIARLLIEKDGTQVTGVQPSLVGNFSNTFVLKIDFEQPPLGGPAPMDPEGNWTISLADVAEFKISYCRVTALVDDHLFNYDVSYEGTPRVNVPLILSGDLDFVGSTIEDGSIEAAILRPGKDWGDFLANYAGNVDASSDPEAGSPGEQKFNHLWANDSLFRAALGRSENLINLNHSADGHYEATFSGVTNAGVYRILFRINAIHPNTGEYHRIKSQSFYASFNEIDLEASQVTTQLQGGQLIMQIKPRTPYNVLVGPAMGSAFSVDNPGIQISSIVDHQDGNYTLTFDGDVDQSVTLSLLGQDVFTGKLPDMGESDSIIDKIEEWLESLGLPAWLIWILLLILLLFLLWLIFRKKNP